MSTIELHFDPVTHTYTADGRVVPHVTSIVPKPDLSRVPEDVLEAARLEGMRRHELARAYLTDEVGRMILTDGDNAFLSAFDEFWTEHGQAFGDVLAAEIPLVSRGSDRSRRFAGTPDIVCSGAVLDLKRTFISARLHALQAVGYELLARQNKILSVRTQRWFIVEAGAEKIRFRNVYNRQAEAMFLDLVNKKHTELNLERYLQAA